MMIQKVFYHFQGLTDFFVLFNQELKVQSVLVQVLFAIFGFEFFIF